MSIFEKKKKVPSAEEYGSGRIYDYSTPEGRVSTASWLFEQAKDERTVRENEWVRFNDYYNFAHDAAKETAAAMQEMGVEWSPAVVPDPWIMVESQIIPDVPQPEFHGRDDDQDSNKAKKRELAVRYIIEANRLNDMNTSNERRLRKFGDAFWKAYYDEGMPFGPKKGNIRIVDVAVEDIYPDPTAGRGGLQACEYVDYVYTMHKLKFWRIYHNEVEKAGLTLEELLGTQYRTEDGIFDPTTSPSNYRDDMIQILEHWYRQPFDTKDAPAGSIACTVQAGGIELKYIPNYWKKTGEQCQLFPFVHYWCVRDETTFWNKSELESILLLVDAADRELAIGQFNDAMMANDIVLVEEGAVASGSEFTNAPGAVVTMKQGRMGGAARLGGLHSGIRSANMVEWLMKQMQRANRNFDSNNGQETARVTTASGISQLRADAENQQKLKKADRDAGFCRLYELLDWLALEFFDDGRLLFIGAQKKGEEPKTLKYNSDEFAIGTQPVLDMETGKELKTGGKYYPRVDVTVTAGNGIAKNPITTVEILEKLAGTQVNEDNWEILSAQLEYLDIPQKQDIIDGWRNKFAPVIPKEVYTAVENDPELLSQVIRLVAEAEVDKQIAAEQKNRLTGMPTFPEDPAAQFTGSAAMPMGAQPPVGTVGNII